MITLYQKENAINELRQQIENIQRQIETIRQERDHLEQRYQKKLKNYNDRINNLMKIKDDLERQIISWQNMRVDNSRRF